MTLKEILQERKRAAQSNQATAVLPNTDNHVVEQVPACVYSRPMSEFQALFVGIEDF